MHRSNTIILVLIFIFSVSFLNSAIAQDVQSSYGPEPGQKDVLLKSFNGSVSLMLADRDKLGLSEDQIKKIKDLSVKVRKAVIKMGAEIRTLRVDMNTTVWEAPLDLNESNSLLARSHSLFEDRGKFLLNSIHELHQILTPEQLKSFNSLV